MKRDLHAIDRGRFTVWLRFNLRLWIKTDTRKFLALLRNKITTVSAVCVIGMSVGYYRPLDRLPRVDVEITAFAKEASTRQCDQTILVHKQYFTAFAASNR